MTAAPGIRDMTLMRDDPMLEVFSAIVQLEAARRRRESGSRKASLAEFEREYHGVEVGHARRAINRTIERVFEDPGRKSLLDYGCGGSWWKDSYWPRFRRVLAVEVDEDALLDIARNYGGTNTELVLTRNGLIDCDERFDYVLSSGVVGYVHPRQAEAHLRSCYGLLVAGGTLVLSRVRAHNFGHWISGARLEAIPEFSFTYAYTKKDLARTLSDIGFRQIRYHEHGIWFPFGDRLNQRLFRIAPRMMQAWCPRLFPFLRFEHMFTAVRQA